MHTDQTIETSFEDLMSELDLSKLHTQSEVHCFSDYTGDHKGCRNDVYGFLCVGSDSISLVKNQLTELRKKNSEWSDMHFLQYKENKQKHLSKLRENVLKDFMEIVNGLTGYLYVISIDKDVDTLLLKEGSAFVNGIVKDQGYGKWKDHIAKRQQDILLCLSLILSKIIGDDQKVVCISNMDATNDEGKGRFGKVKDLFDRFLEFFNVDADHVTLLTDRGLSPDTNVIGDLISVVDLSIGALSEFLESRYGESKLKRTSNTTLKWFSDKNKSLDKMHIEIIEHDGAVKMLCRTLVDSSKVN